MALFRKFFSKKLPEGLLELSERVFVFDCCFTTDSLEDDKYKAYIGGVVAKLRDHFPDASCMVFNFREGKNQSLIGSILSQYKLTVMDYPRHFEGCPVLTIEMVHDFLSSVETWLLSSPQNLLLLHCEQGGWSTLAFMMAALLIYKNQHSGEQKTLDMIYKQAPHELLQLLSPLNPLPSQLRYLQYVSRRNVGSEWPPIDRTLTLDFIIMRVIPKWDVEGGIRPIFRVHGHDPAMVADRTPHVLFSTPKRNEVFRQYKQADCELVKIDIHSDIRGDVVLECITLDDTLEHEEIVFRVMFNTAFLRENILIFNRDEVDIPWNCKDLLPEEFRVEILFSVLDTASSVTAIDLPKNEDKESLAVETFDEVQEISNNEYWFDQEADLTPNVLQQIKLKRGSGKCKYEVEKKLMVSGVEQSLPSMEKSEDANSTTDKVEEKIAQKGQQVASLESSQDPQIVPNGATMEPSHIADSRALRTVGKELKVNSQRPNQLNIISQWLPPSSLHAPGLQNTSVHGSPQSLSRYHSAPSSLGITALLEDHVTAKTEEIKHTLASPSSPCISSPIFGVAMAAQHGIAHAIPKLSPVPPIPQLPPPAPPGPINNSAEVQTTNDRACANTQSTVAPTSSSTTPSIAPSQQQGKLLKDTNQSSVSSPPPFKASTLVSDPTSHASPPKPPPPAAPISSPIYPSLPPLAQLKSFHPAIASSLTSMLKLPSIPPPFSPLLASKTLSTAVKENFPPVPPPPPIFSNSRVVHSALPPPPPPPPPPFRPSLCPPPVSSTSRNVPSPPPPPPPPPPHCAPALNPMSTPLVSSSPPPPCAIPALSSSRSGVVPIPPRPPSPTCASSLSPTSRFLVSTTPPPPPPCAIPASSSSRSFCPPPPSGVFSQGPTPPPPPIANGSPRGNGPAPPTPSPPAAPFLAKGQALPRTYTKTQFPTKKTNMKPYHWLKLTRAMQGSLWAEAQKSSESLRPPEFDMSELESLFSASNPNSNSLTTDGKSGHAAGRKPDKIQLIDFRRAYNCEIMLTKVKIPLSELMSCVLALDDSALDVDQVESLIKFCPTKEEMELLRNYTGDKENLGKCEKFFLELMKVPRVESKLRVLSFNIQFNCQVSDLRRSLNVVDAASEEIRSSVKLKRIMQTILSLGNALNQGTARGSAIGFRLDSLLKLTDTRARNNKITLMHYLCKVLAEKLPEVIDFPNDLVNLESSTKIQLKYLAEEMQAISKGLKKVVQEVYESENDGPTSQSFCKILKEFLAFAEAEVRSLASMYSNVGRNADALAFYFGEDPGRCPFEQVVSTLSNFVRMFIRAHDENCKQRESEKKKKKLQSESLKVGALQAG